MWWILVAAAAVAFGYWSLTRPRNYWAKKGVKQGPPSFILRDILEMVLRKRSFAEMVQIVYNMCPNTRWVKLCKFFYRLTCGTLGTQGSTNFLFQHLY
mgnify:CR=1 FL=1